MNPFLIPTLGLGKILAFSKAGNKSREYLQEDIAIIQNDLGKIREEGMYNEGALHNIYVFF